MPAVAVSSAVDQFTVTSVDAAAASRTDNVATPPSASRIDVGDTVTVATSSSAIVTVISVSSGATPTSPPPLNVTTKVSSPSTTVSSVVSIVNVVIVPPSGIHGEYPYSRGKSSRYDAVLRSRSISHRTSG